MEKHVFTHRKVREAFKKLVVVKLYCDQKYGPTADERMDFNLALEEKLANSSQQPAYVIIDPESGRRVANWGYDYEHLQKPQLFAERMEAGIRAVKALKAK